MKATHTFQSQLVGAVLQKYTYRQSNTTACSVNTSRHFQQFFLGSNIMKTMAYKENRLVTMNMDISYCFHSYLIGRNGQNIDRIRKKTQTTIHVSDRKLINSDVCNSDVVTISGELENLENVVGYIRVSVDFQWLINIFSS